MLKHDYHWTSFLGFVFHVWIQIMTDHNQQNANDSTLHDNVVDKARQIVGRIRRGEISISKGSMLCACPYSTLYGIVHYGQPLFPEVIPTYVFSTEEMLDMRFYIQMCEMMQRPRCSNGFLHEVQLYVALVGLKTQFSENKPDIDWLTHLLKYDNLDIKLKTENECLTAAEAEMCLDNWMPIKLHTIHHLNDCQMPNYDSQFFLCEFGQLKFGFDDADIINILLTYNARGEILKPTLVYNGEFDEEILTSYSSHMSFYEDSEGISQMMPFINTLEQLEAYWRNHLVLCPIILNITHSATESFLQYGTWAIALKSRVIPVCIPKCMDKVLRLGNLGLLSTVQAAFQACFLEKKIFSDYVCTLNDVPELLLAALNNVRISDSVNRIFSTLKLGVVDGQPNNTRQLPTEFPQKLSDSLLPMETKTRDPTD